MSKRYIPLILDIAAWCSEYFKNALIASYLHGSVASNDAVPYVSDLDTYIVVSRNLNEEDNLKINQKEVELQKQYPFVNGVHLSVHSIEELKKDSFARFILKYNAKLLCGVDIIDKLHLNGYAVMEPNLETAKARVPFAKNCFQQALSGNRPACTGEIPDNVFFASRKFARYFVVIEGAYYLMSVNRFVSFAKEDVLEGLIANCKGYEDIITLSARVLRDPIDANIPGREYLKTIRPLVEWFFERIETA